MTSIGQSEIHPGRKIAARRAELRKSLMDIENETEGVIYSKLLYRIENAKKPLETLNVKQLDALLKALEWTPQEFAEATGVEVPGVGLSPSTETEQRSAEDIGGIMLKALKTTPEELKKVEQSLKELDELFRYTNDELRRKYEKTKELLRQVIKLGTAEGRG